jgi:hypothetical protein
MTTKQTTTFFKNPTVLAQKLGRKRKKLSKSVSGYYKTKKKKKKVAWTTKPLV